MIVVHPSTEVPAAGNRIFAGIDEPTLSLVSALADEVEAEEGEVLFDEADEGDHLYLILRGAVSISRAGREGRRITLAHFGPGEFFGEMAIYDDGPRSARATAVLPSRFARLDAAAFHAALEMAPARITANLTAAIIERVRAANDRRLEEELRAERLRLVGAMAASIAHDLKSPIGVVQLLADAAPRETAEMLEKTARRMSAMVQDLLDFSRGETTLHPRPVRVRELVEEIEELGLSGAARLGVQVDLRVAVDGVLSADPDALARVFLNLTKNALEAMPDGGVLTLAVEPRGGGVAFTVADTGCGIDEDHLPRVFEPFATFGKPGGTGLGMATAKAVVEAHGGTIRLASRPGAGTTCEVVLPGLRRVDANEAAAAAAQETNG